MAFFRTDDISKAFVFKSKHTPFWPKTAVAPSVEAVYIAYCRIKVVAATIISNE